VYVNFYGLREKPFNTTPDPRFLFLTASHREALSQLTYGVREGTGFAVLAGPIGTGKTTLLQTLLQRIDPQTAVAMIVNPSVDFDGLLELILDDFGIGQEAGTTAQRMVALNRFLLEQATSGRQTLLVIDEAQHLEPTTLERIRLISNYESSTRKLLQIILAGQPELVTKLNLPQLRQLKQRIGLWCEIQPLTPKEVREYVSARLRVAKAANPRLFTERALDRIASHSHGIPRLINILCEHCLLIGYADQIRQIDHRLVKEAIVTMEAASASGRPRARGWLRPRPARWRWILGAGLAAVAGTLGGAVWYTGGTAVLGEAMSAYGATVSGVVGGVEALLRP
jgi:general secretion pathway protein A